MGNRDDGKRGSDNQTEAAKINAQTQIYTAKIVADTEVEVAEKNREAHVISAHAQLDSAEINADAQKKSAAISATAKVKVAQITNDPLTLDSNEAVAYELIKKTGILTDLSAFEVKLASGDKEAKANAINLETALKKDGKELTVDGKITDKTIAAAQGLIGENSEAILKYEEVLNKLSSKSPLAAGAKVQNTEIERK